MHRRPILSIATLLLLLAAHPAGAQARFRASLTATVITSGAERSKAATLAGAPRDERGPAASAALGCREIILRWTELAGAKRYSVYVSPRSAGPWSELPASNVCGSVRWQGATGLVDTEPTAGAPSVVRRLYYKVFALGGAAAEAPPLDVTDPVAVELP